MNESLCIIPARGGSKRIPKKNIKLFFGKPIISYSIEVAQRSGLFSEIMVSTDCDEISDVARKFGASVPFLRSAQNADDHATTVDVVNEVLGCYTLKGREFTRVCVLYPCAPFVREADLIKAFEILNGCDCVIPVVAYDFSPFRSFSLTDGRLAYTWPEYEKTRSQDLKELYHDAGQWYFFKHDASSHHTLVKPNTQPLLLDNMRVQDIDSIGDWDMAELKYQQMS